MSRRFDLAQKDLAEGAEKVKHGQNGGEQSHGRSGDQAGLDRADNDQELGEEPPKGGMPITEKAQKRKARAVRGMDLNKPPFRGCRVCEWRE